MTTGVFRDSFVTSIDSSIDMKNKYVGLAKTTMNLDIT